MRNILEIYKSTFLGSFKGKFVNELLMLDRIASIHPFDG